MIGILSQGPGLAHEGSDASADGEIDALDEGGLNESGETMFFKKLIEILTFAPSHTHRGKFGSAAFVLLDQLAMQQVFRNLPMIGTSALGAEPTSKVGGYGVEVATQAIGGESGDAIGLETQLEIVGEYHRIFVFAVAKVQSR